jgi:hypothetical protein
VIANNRTRLRLRCRAVISFHRATVATAASMPATLDPDVTVVTALPAALLPAVVGALALPAAIGPHPLATAAMVAALDPDEPGAGLDDDGPRRRRLFVDDNDRRSRDVSMSTRAHHASSRRQRHERRECQATECLSLHFVPSRHIDESKAETIQIAKS